MPLSRSASVRSSIWPAQKRSSARRNTLSFPPSAREKSVMEEQNFIIIGRPDDRMEGAALDGQHRLGAKNQPRPEHLMLKIGASLIQ